MYNKLIRLTHNYIMVIACLYLFNWNSYGFAAMDGSDSNNQVTTSSTTKEDPVQFLHSKIDQVLTKLKANNKKDLKDITKIVDELIIPNVDFNEMGQRIAGKSAWSKATQSDQEDFIREIKKLLINTYVVTLKTYNEEKIEFQNHYGKVGANKVQIRSTIIRPNKDNLLVDYRLIACGNSWRVYDLIIEGVSILSGFSSEFGDDIRMNGLRFVTTKIKQHNKDNLAKQ